MQFKIIKVMCDQFYYKGSMLAEAWGSMEHSVNATGLVNCVGSR